MSGSANVTFTYVYNYSGGLYDYPDKEFRGFNSSQETRPDNIGCASDEAGDADKMTTREDAKAILAGRMKRAKEMLKGETHAISEEINSKIASLGDEERLRVEVHIDSPEMYPCLKKYLLDRFDSLSDLSVFSRHNGCVYATLNKHEITDIASQVPYVTSIDLP